MAILWFANVRENWNSCEPILLAVEGNLVLVARRIDDPVDKYRPIAIYVPGQLDRLTILC